MSEKIMRLIENLIREDSKNPYTLYFERIIAELTKTLEDVEREIISLSGSLEQEKAIYNKVKTSAPEFKGLLKPLTKEQFVEFVDLVGIDYDFKQIDNDVEASIAVVMEEKRELLENYKSQMTALEVQRDSLSKDIEENQNKLNAQKELRERLIELKEKAKEQESTVTKAAVYAVLKECVDSNGEPIFSEEDLDIAANIIMFPANFIDQIEDKRPLSDIFKLAREAGELGENPSLEQGATIKRLEMPTVGDLQKSPADKAEKSNVAAQADKYGPWANGDSFSDIDDLLSGAYLEEEPEEPVIEQDPDKDDAPSENPYDLIEALREDEESDVTKTEAPVAKEDSKPGNFEKNVAALRSLGLPGDPHKYPMTLSEVSNEDIEKALELAKTYGITIRNVGDIVKILSSNNVKEAFEKAIQTYGEDYPTAVKSATPSKLIGVYKPYLGEKKYAVREYISTPELVDALDTVKEDVYDSSSYMAAIGLMNKLEKFDHNNYALFVNDKSFPKTTVLRNLERLMSLNPSNPDEELMLIALTYDPQLSSLDVESIKNELHEKYGYEEVKRMAA